MCVATYYVIMRKSATVISQTKCRIGVCVSNAMWWWGKSMLFKHTSLRVHTYTPHYTRSPIHWIWTEFYFLRLQNPKIVLRRNKTRYRIAHRSISRLSLQFMRVEQRQADQRTNSLLVSPTLHFVQQSKMHHFLLIVYFCVRKNRNALYARQSASNWLHGLLLLFVIVIGMVFYERYRHGSKLRSIAPLTIADFGVMFCHHDGGIWPISFRRASTDNDI